MSENRADIMKSVRAIKYALRHNYWLPEVKEGLENALELLREELCEYDKKHEITSCISNKYVLHFNQDLPDFETGYNAAIRDVLDILEKERF